MARVGQCGVVFFLKDTSISSHTKNPIPPLKNAGALKIVGDLLIVESNTAYYK